MENPKLALIPSGYKSGKVYSILPVNGVGDFDFSRNTESSRVNKEGLIETVDNNVPKLDWLNSDCPSLLLEPQRTNYALNSENTYAMTVIGGSENAIRTANYSISPRGSLTASRLQASVTSGTNNYSVVGSSTTSYNGYYTASIYLKSNTGENQQVAIYGRNSTLLNYTVTKDWKRFSFYGYNSPGQTAYINVGILEQLSGSNLEIDISLFGVQIEQDNYPTSLITTQSNIVTRLKDECNNAGDSQLLNNSENTFFIDLNKIYKTGTADSRISLNDGSATNRVLFSTQTNDTTIILYSIRNNVTTTVKYFSVDYDARNSLYF
jgi:hypothetical protein